MRNMLLFKRPFLIVCLLFTSAIAFGQVTEKWVKREAGDINAPDNVEGLVVDNNCNVIVTGSSGGGFVTVKYNDDGNTKWVKKYNGPGGDDRPTAIITDHNNNIYITGVSNGIGSGGDYATVKYDDDGNTKWVKRFNGTGNNGDQPTAIAVDDYGNVYVTGWSTGSGSGTDITTIKYDREGNTKWVRTYNGPANSYDEATAIAVDEKGNVYVAGSSTGKGTLTDYTTIKYDKEGHQKWVKRYNGSMNNRDRANALALDKNGNVYVTGYTTIFEGEDGDVTDIVTIKYNGSGVQQWAKIYDRKGRDEARAIAVDKSGNVYLTGFSGEPELDPINDYVTVKYNTSGKQLWDASLDAAYGPGQHGGARDLVLDKAGNVYVTGSISTAFGLYSATVMYDSHGKQQWKATYVFVEESVAIGLDKNGNVYITGTGNNDYTTVRYNTGGEQDWVKRYNGPAGDQITGSNDYAEALAVDKEGNVHVTGSIYKNNTGVDYATFKYSKDGQRIWKKTYNGADVGADEAAAITVDVDGNVYVTGSSLVSETRTDYVTIKYDKDGNTRWSKRYNGPGNLDDRPTGIAVDRNGNVYVTGTSWGGTSFEDYATIKYDKDGNKKWVKRYNGSGGSTDRALAIAVDEAGNVYVTGESRNASNQPEFATIKYDAGGNERWVATVNGSGRKLLVDAAGNVYVTGNGDGGYKTIKYNSSGIQQWAVNYKVSLSYHEARDIALDTAGNVYITGESAGDYATVKYNAGGIQRWAARYPSYTGANALAVDASGNVYVTGASTKNNAKGIATVKYDSAGTQQWVARYNGPRNAGDIANDIGLDTAGNVYVTGQSAGIGYDYDYVTIKYEQEPVVTPTSPNYVQLNNLVVVYKNTNGGPIPDDYAATLNATLEETRLFYWRHSHMQLNIKWTVYEIDDYLPRVHEYGYVYPWEVSADLRSRGFTNNAYDAVVAIARGSGAFGWGANQVLGKGGYCQVLWLDDKRTFSWYIVHEFHHVVDALFAASGDPDYPHNHPSDAKRLGEFVPHSGTNWDLNKEILQYWPPAKWRDLSMNGVWGIIKSFTDNDKDSIPDNDANVPLDEVRLGSNPSRIDTDNDGLTDLQEAMVGIFTPTNATNSDSDGDGINDNIDPEPLYPLKTNVPATGSLSPDQDITAWPLAGHYFFEKPDSDSSSLHLGYSENNLYVGVKIPSGLQPVTIYIDANNDGVFYGNDNIQVRLAGNTITGVTLNNENVPAGNPPIISALPVTGFCGKSKAGANWSSYQLIIPKLAQYGLNLTAGDTLGIYVFVEGYGTMLEPDDYMTVVLGEGANKMITRRETNPIQSGADEVLTASAKLTAKAFPNAFTNYINLQWSGSNKPVSITITDAMGRLAERKTGLASSGMLKTGSNFTQGIYFAEIVQGTDKVVLKLIKQ